MGILALISIAFIIGRYINNLFGEKKEEQVHVIKKHYSQVKYYSQGLELSRPFYIEYKMINSSMNKGRWPYHISYEHMLHLFPDKPIMDAEFYHPIKRSYTYTITNAELAKVFFRVREDYLGFLN